MTEPLRIAAGTSLAWSRSWSIYPSATWTLVYQLTSRDAVYQVTASANADGVTFDVAEPAATSQGWIPGRYRLTGHVANGGDRHRVVDTFVEVDADLSAGEVKDSRTHARKVLDAVEATIEGRASIDQQSIQIGGRAIARHSIGELLALKTHYRWIVQGEEGKRTGPMVNIGVRFGRG